MATLTHDPATIKGFFENYKKHVAPNMKEVLKLKTVMSVPRLEKIVLNMGLGEAKNNKNVLTEGINALALLSGQKPISCLAKRSEAGFKIREGMPIGAKVTLRRERMYDFFVRLVHVAIPRVKDFHGLEPTGFDGRGNYTFGLSDVTVFPELASNYSPVLGGLSIVMVTSVASDKTAYLLLKEMGIPFKEPRKPFKS
ncbi:50S ribosomal protein L5 [Spirochaetota bacterium]|nr:50S ribosomal protein L5 [Spirochaetota bacterium]